jgi:transposase
MPNITNISGKLAFAGFFLYNRAMRNINFEGLPTPVTEYIHELEAKLDGLQKQVDRLTEMLILAQKARFGAKSEKTKYALQGDSAQISLFNEAEVCADEKAPEPVIVKQHKRKAKRTKEELAKDLPVEEVVIDIPEARRTCNICEGKLHPIGKELVRRELSIIPAQAYVTETYRINYACDDCEKETDQANIIKPEVLEPVVKRGLASPSSAAYTMYQKYANGMPLARQAKDWETFGVKISRATLANWIIYTSSHWLLPLWEALKTQLILSPVIMADESVIQVLKEPGKTPQSESRMWVYCTGNTDSPPIILYEYQPNRSGENPKRFLAGAKDFYLQSDAYSGYNKVENTVHCACWSHMKRKYSDALPKTDLKDSKAAQGIAFCDKLFILERDFKDLSPEERLKQRHEKSKPVLDAYFAWVATVNPLAGCKLAEAITYARNQREPLSAFLLDGRIEISTNRIENHIRPFAYGRRSWLFADTVAGAKASAVAYSIIETARANGLNPYQYLLYLFTELPTFLTKDPKADLSRFFPWAGNIQEKCRRTQGAAGQLTRLS